MVSYLLRVVGLVLEGGVSGRVMRQKLGELGIAEVVTHLLRRRSATSTTLRLGSLCRGHLLCELPILSVICSLYHAACLSSCLVYVFMLVEMTRGWRG
jgi:hypothetical protein